MSSVLYVTSIQILIPFPVKYPARYLFEVQCFVSCILGLLQTPPQNRGWGV